MKWNDKDFPNDKSAIETLFTFLNLHQKEEIILPFALQPSPKGA